MPIASYILIITKVNKKMTTVTPLNWNCERILGTGGFGIVKLWVHKTTGQKLGKLNMYIVKIQLYVASVLNFFCVKYSYIYNSSTKL